MWNRFVTKKAVTEKVNSMEKWMKFPQFQRTQCESIRRRFPKQEKNQIRDTFRFSIQNADKKAWNFTIQRKVFAERRSRMRHPHQKQQQKWRHKHTKWNWNSDLNENLIIMKWNGTDRERKHHEENEEKANLKNQLVERKRQKRKTFSIFFLFSAFLDFFFFFFCLFPVVSVVAVPLWQESLFLRSFKMANLFLIRLSAISPSLHFKRDENSLRSGWGKLSLKIQLFLCVCESRVEVENFLVFLNFCFLECPFFQRVYVQCAAVNKTICDCFRLFKCWTYPFFDGYLRPWRRNIVKTLKMLSCYLLSTFLLSLYLQRLTIMFYASTPSVIAKIQLIYTSLILSVIRFHSIFRFVCLCVLWGSISSLS